MNSNRDRNSGLPKAFHQQPGQDRDKASAGRRLPGLLILVAGLLLAGTYFQRYLDQPLAYGSVLWQRFQLWQALRKVDAISNEAMEIDTTANGGLLITSKYAIVQVLPNGQQRTALSFQQARQMTHTRLGAFATAELMEDGSLWIGSWHGTVLRLSGSELQVVSDRDTAPKGRIRDIAETPTGIYVGGDGLWRHDGEQERLQPIDETLRVRALAVDPEDRLIVAGSAVIHTLDKDGQLIARWQADTEDGSIEALTLEPDGTQLVGTRKGVVVLEPDGRVRTRLLQGEQIEGFARDTEGRLWVATWKSGIGVPTADGWERLGYSHGLPNDSVSDIGIDAGGQLWMAIYGGGAYRVETARLHQLLAKRQRPEIDPNVALYPNACAAAESELPANGDSGQVGSEHRNGQIHVFFGGRQVCPPAPGFRTADGETWSTVGDDGHLQLQEGDTGPTQIALPSGLSSAMVTAVYRDPLKRWWIGSRHLGLFELTAEGWKHHGREAGLGNTPIQAIEADTEGRLWVASYPRGARPGGNGKSLDGAGLHWLEHGQWHARVPRTRGRSLTQLPNRGLFNDLASHQSNDLRVLRDGRVAIATNAGLSLLATPDDIRSFDRYNLGMPSSFINSVTEDAEGRLWMTHAYWGAGVTWKAGMIFMNRNTRDGLFADRLIALAHDGRNRVWLQASDGRVAIYERPRLMR